MKISSENTEWAMSFSTGQNLYVADADQRDLSIMEWVKNQPIDRVATCHLSLPRRTVSEGSVIVQTFQNSKKKWGSENYWNSLKIARQKLTSELSDSIGKEKLDKTIQENRLLLMSSEKTNSTIFWPEALDRMIHNIVNYGEDAAEMVMFASRNDIRLEQVKKYLKERNIYYVDYVSSHLNDENEFDKRLPLPANFIRLTTIHQARGIDATNAIVFGLDHDIHDVINGRRFKEDTSYRLNLWYIALTRSRNFTYLDADLTEIQTEYMLTPELVHNSALLGFNDDIMNRLLAIVDFRN
jgi:hypothetical protein